MYGFFGDTFVRMYQMADIFPYKLLNALQFFFIHTSLHQFHHAKGADVPVRVWNIRHEFHSAWVSPEIPYKDIGIEYYLGNRSFLRSATHSATFFMSFLSFHIPNPTGLNSRSSFKRGLITATDLPLRVIVTSLPFRIVSRIEEVLLLSSFAVAVLIFPPKCVFGSIHYLTKVSI